MEKFKFSLHSYNVVHRGKWIVLEKKNMTKTTANSRLSLHHLNLLNLKGFLFRESRYMKTKIKNTHQNLVLVKTSLIYLYNDHTNY